MANWPVQKQTLGTTQNLQINQTGLYCLFRLDFSILFITFLFIKMISPRNVESAPRSG